MFDERALDQFKERHRFLVRSEKVGPVRQLLRVGYAVNPKRTADVESLFAYMRIIDDFVDETPYIQEAAELLSQERRGLQKSDMPTPLQREYVSEPIARIYGSRSMQARRYLDVIFSGLQMDVNIRDTQQPLGEMRLKVRNFRVTYPPFALFFMGLNNTPRPNAETVTLFDDLATYDNVSDIFEDLPHGLILLSQEDIDRFGLTFPGNQELSTKALLAYNDKKRAELRSRLRRSSSYFLTLGLQPWLGVVFYMYAYTRTLKLLKGLSEQQGLKFSLPLDGSSNHKKPTAIINVG
jgi:hypothetical protein